MRKLIAILVLASSPLAAQSRSQLTGLMNRHRLIRSGAAVVWNLTQASGSTATDLTGNGHFLTKYADAPPTSTATGWSFGGIPQSASSLNFSSSSGALTLLGVAIWSSQTEYQGLLYVGLSTYLLIPGKAYVDWADGDASSGGDGYGVNARASGASGLTPGGFHMLASTLSANTHAVYVDKANVTERGSDSAIPELVNRTIGVGWDSDDNNYLNGTVAFACIYNRALTSSEMTHNYYALKWLLAPAGVALP